MRKSSSIPTLGRAVPSYANELAYRKKLLALIAEMTAETEREIKAYFNSEVVHDAASYRLRQILKALRQKWYKRFERMGKEFNDWFYKTTEKRTRRQIAEKLKEIGWTIRPNYTKAQKEAITNLSKESVKLIKRIPQKYLKRVQRVVSVSVKRGGDREMLTRFTQKIFENLMYQGDKARNHAILLARDQSNKVTQNLAIIDAQAVGATRGKWIHVPGTYSSRITHEAMDGETFDLSVGMYDEEVRRYVKPGELIYCNCQFEVLLPGFGASELEYQERKNKEDAEAQPSDEINMKNNSSPLNNNREDGKIEVNKISGGVLEDWDAYEAKSKEMYAEIEKRSNDIEPISQNTGYSVDVVDAVKHYSFLDEHQLSDGYRKFDPDADMAESWNRLAGNKDNILPHDIILLKHEIEEMKLVNSGVPQNKAHEIVSKKYNYKKALNEYKRKG